MDNQHKMKMLCDSYECIFKFLSYVIVDTFEIILPSIRTRKSERI